jgi:plasmid stabilization system protein ParE
VKLLTHYPYKIFYRVRGGAVEIVHIRHAVRRPWKGPER